MDNIFFGYGIKIGCREQTHEDPEGLNKEQQQQQQVKGVML